MPTGRVKWFDTERGFGFIASDEGGDVYVHKSALPAGVAELDRGARVEFGVADGRRGQQALSVRVLTAPPSLVEAARRKPEELNALIEDMIKVLDSEIQPTLRRGRHVPAALGARIAQVMRAIADDLAGGPHGGPHGGGHGGGPGRSGRQT